MKKPDPHLPKEPFLSSGASGKTTRERGWAANCFRCLLNAWDFWPEETGFRQAAIFLQMNFELFDPDNRLKRVPFPSKDAREVPVTPKGNRGCPFCGGLKLSSVQSVNDPKISWITCETCGCTGPNTSNPLTGWNFRTDEKTGKTSTTYGDPDLLGEIGVDIRTPKTSKKNLSTPITSEE